MEDDKCCNGMADGSICGKGADAVVDNDPDAMTSGGSVLVMGLVSTSCEETSTDVASDEDMSKRSSESLQIITKNRRN